MIEATIKQINNQQAQIQLSNGEQITVSTSILPAQITVGDNIVIEFTTQAEYKQKQNQTAQEVLNKIMQS